MIPTIMSWSGGKDSCMALHALQRGGIHAVTGLLTTASRDDGRIALHGVHRDLVARQAAALGLPIDVVPLPAAASNAAYEAAIGEAFATHRENGIEAIAFGDLFLADIREYRERLVARTGLAPVFPVWGRDTAAFVADFLAAGFRAVVVSVDLAVLDGSFAERLLDADFIAALPATVDPCGENGEFHSFVFAGPNFAAPVDVRIGECFDRDGYRYCEVSCPTEA